MIKPVKRNLDLYKGADFIFEFRIKSDGASIGDHEITFKASEMAGTASVISLSSSDSPETITIDSADDNLITIRIDAIDTAALTNKELYYEIDSIDTNGIVSRWMMGQINIYEGADA